MNVHGKINYVEFHAADLVKTKAFFADAFNWEFTDFGPDYTAFSGEGLDGGFFKSDKLSVGDDGAPLIIFYSDNLEDTLVAVEAAGGAVNRAIFDFPGGRRFHFKEPSGNEFAVWSDRTASGKAIES